MKDVITFDQKQKIAEMVIHGESPNDISKTLGLTINRVLMVLGDADFSAKLLELFKNSARGVALIAHQNITRIAFDPNATQATQLKASKILIDIAREMNEIHANDLEPAYMTQNQLADRVKALHKEIAVRAKPIDTGIIEHVSIDDMLD